jgi:hypothetical protein
MPSEGLEPEIPAIKPQTYALDLAAIGNGSVICIGVFNSMTNVGETITISLLYVVYLHCSPQRNCSLFYPSTVECV